ncbi:MAG: Calx-beta domain-containing protein, partial [Euryarchaeota archaeon]
MNEPLPLFSMESIFVDEGDQDKSIFLSMILSKAWDSPVTVTLKTVNGTAVAGEDFVGIDNEVIEFAIGSRQENLRIELLADEIWEEDEQFTVELVSITEASVNNNSVTITIENDDIQGQFNLPGGYSTPDNYEGMNLVWS